MPLVEQELPILPEHLSSPPDFSGVRVAQYWAFCVMICGPVRLFVLFILPLYCLSLGLDLQLFIPYCYQNFLMECFSWYYSLHSWTCWHKLHANGIGLLSVLLILYFSLFLSWVLSIYHVVTFMKHNCFVCVIHETKLFCVCYSWSKIVLCVLFMKHPCVMFLCTCVLCVSHDI